MVLSWHKDWTGERDPKAIRTRRSYLRAIEPNKIRKLASRARGVRDGRLDLAEELALPIFDELEMADEVYAVSHPLKLLALADVHGDDEQNVQQRFEALCVLDLAAMSYELERIDPMVDVEEDVDAMRQLLQRSVLIDGSRKRFIYTYHDPEDMYRVKAVSYDVPGTFGKLLERKHNSRVRMTREGVTLRTGTRAKNRFRTVMKLLQQQIAPKEGHDPMLVKDRCGFKFVVESIDAVNALAEELVWNLIAFGAEVYPDSDNLTKETGTAADPTNSLSSPKYKQKQLAVFWHNRWYEFQIVTFGVFYSAKYAHDEENHTIYKMRQGMKNMLPLLFPGKIYLPEQSWQDASLQQLLYERQRENLGWFHERQKRNGNGSKH
ncbi:MAG: hypothetical protein WCO25_01640 [Candidatus Uhrbacteria bacterium]